MSTDTSEFYCTNGTDSLNESIEYLLNPDETKRPHRVIYAVSTCEEGAKVLELLQLGKRDNLYFISMSNSISMVAEVSNKIHEINQTDDSAVIITTHLTIDFSEDWSNNHDWHLIIGGGLDAVTDLSIPLPYNKEFITKWMWVQKTGIGGNGVNYRMCFHPATSAKYLPGEYETIMQAEVPESCDVPAGAIMLCVRSGRIILVEVKAWEKYMRGKLTGVLPITGLRHPQLYSGFKRTIFMSDNFKESVFCKWFIGTFSTEFKDFSQMTNES